MPLKKNKLGQIVQTGVPRGGGKAAAFRSTKGPSMLKAFLKATKKPKKK